MVSPKNLCNGGENSRQFYLLGIIALCLLWVIVSAVGNGQFFASPIDTFKKLWELVIGGSILTDLAVSIARLFFGFALATAIGVPIGILVGSSKEMRDFLEPFLGMFRYVPAAALIPLSILWIGLSESQKYFLVFFGTFPFAVLYVSNAVASIEHEYFQVAYSLGASWNNIVLKVILPKIMPDLIEIIRIELAGAWGLVITAELVSATSGIGHRLILAQRFLRTQELFALLLLTLLIGLFIDKSLRFANSSFFPWAVKNRIVD